MTSVCDRLQQQRQQLTAELATRDRDDSEPLPMSTRLRAMISVRNLKGMSGIVSIANCFVLLGYWISDGSGGWTLSAEPPSGHKKAKVDASAAVA